MFVVPDVFGGGPDLGINGVGYFGVVGDVTW